MNSIPRIFLLSFFTFLFVLPACKSPQNGSRSENVSSAQQRNQVQRHFQIFEPQNNSYVNPGSDLPLKLVFTGDEINIDSITIELEGMVLMKKGPGSLNNIVQIPTIAPGTSNLRVKIQWNDTLSENHAVRLKITSDIEPLNYTYRVTNTYPHDKGAFTQGFEYINGFLYEGTGNYGESSLRKVELETGEILKYRNLSSDLFGEGITRINNKIYQITYRAQVGFVYDEENFELLRKIFYQIREGWGLTNNGEHILMSDGSHIIYYMDTTYFSVEKKIEVYDQEREVDLLNELELINGVLYANRYTTQEIVMIEPETGKLLGRIDMNGILDPSDRHPGIDYFNGIAYDQENDRIFVTGKYWPKVYEVEFIKK